MRNPLFKKQMQEAFQKTAWPHDPAQVAEALQSTDPDVAASIARGQRIGGTAAHLMTHTLPQVARAADSVGSAITAPAALVGKPILRGLGHLGDTVVSSPRLFRAGSGLLMAAPVLAGAFHDSQQRYESELMAMSRDPDRVITASLYDFLEKKAELTARNGVVDDDVKEAAFKVAGIDPQFKKYINRTLGQHFSINRREEMQAARNMMAGSDKRLKGLIGRATSKAVKDNKPATPGFWEATGSKAMESLAGGISGGIGKALAESALSAVGSGIGMLKDYFITDPKRQELLLGLMKTDPIIHDAVTRDPKAKEMLLEAYGTMCRFAPTLSTDINAARSFLRETVLGGSGVNYAIIKSLIETEKALHAKDSRK